MKNERPPRSFGFKTRQRKTGPVIAPDKVIGPTKEEAADANAGNLAPRGLAKRALDAAKKHPIITAGAAIAAIAGGVGAVEAYQGNIPGIQESSPPGSSSDNGVGTGTISETQTTNSKQEVFDPTAAK